MDKVQELRESLKNGRRSTEQSTDSNGISGTSENSHGQPANQPATNGTSIQYLSGSSTGISQSSRPVNQPEKQSRNRTGSITSFDFGERLTNRRPRKDNGEGGSDGTDIPASVTEPATIKPLRQEGNLVAYDIIPQRTFTDDPKATTTTSKPETEGTAQPRKRGRPRKQGIIGAVQNIVSPEIDWNEQNAANKFSEERDKQTPIGKAQQFFKGKTFSQKEAKENYEFLVAALIDDATYMDQFLWAKTGDLTQRPIWSDIDEMEAQTLAKVMLKGAQVNPVVATSVRALIDGKDYIDALMIVGPRIQLTASALKYARLAKQQEKRNRNVSTGR